jgi:hypothetical protein
MSVVVSVGFGLNYYLFLSLFYKNGNLDFSSP